MDHEKKAEKLAPIVESVESKEPTNSSNVAPENSVTLTYRRLYYDSFGHVLFGRSMPKVTDLEVKCDSDQNKRSKARNSR